MECDTCSADEEAYADAQYRSAAAACAASRRQYEDPAFPADRGSIGKGAELTINFLADGAVRKTYVPIAWLRPQQIADENSSFAPGSDGGGGGGADAVAFIRSVASAPVSSDAHIFRDDAQPAAVPSSADVQYLCDAVRRRERGPVAGPGPAWCFKRDRYRSEDVAQGGLGSCWFVSALSLVAEREWLVQRLFRQTPLQDSVSASGGAGGGGGAGYLPLNRHGLYQVRLCINGLWRVITVDDRIPCSSYGRDVAYTSCKRRQIWAALLEKAAAKAVGTYAGLASGRVTEGLKLLTGAPVLSVIIRTAETWTAYNQRLHEERGSGCTRPWEHRYGEVPPAATLDDLWLRLSSYYDAGFLMGASAATPSYNNDVALVWRDVAAWREAATAHVTATRNVKGLVLDHAYSILQVYADPGTGMRLVQLRNPWSTGESRSSGGPNTWTGPWCDAWPGWETHPALRDHCGPYAQAETGVFWMDLDSFATYYTMVDVCKCRGFKPEDGSYDPSRGWHVSRVRVPLPMLSLPGSSARAPFTVLRITPTGNAPVEIVLNQVTARSIDSYDDERPSRPAVYRRSQRNYAARDIGVCVIMDLTDAPRTSGGAGGGAGALPLLRQSTSVGDEDVVAEGVALAAETCRMSIVCTGRRCMRPTMTTEAFLTGNIPVYLLPLSFNGIHDNIPERVLVELHSAKPLVVEAVSQPQPWIARAIITRSLTIGKRMLWGAAAAKPDQTDYIAAAHDDAGTMIVAVNKHPLDSFELTATLSSGIRRDTVVLSRGDKNGSTSGTTDTVRPLSMALLQILSVKPGDSWSWGFNYSLRSGARLPVGRAPPVPAGDLHAEQGYAT